MAGSHARMALSRFDLRRFFCATSGGYYPEPDNYVSEHRPDFVLSLFCIKSLMFISFDPPKEMNQRNRGRKRQLPLFFAICSWPFTAPKNRAQFAPFPDFLSLSIILIFLLVVTE